MSKIWVFIIEILKLRQDCWRRAKTITDSQYEFCCKIYLVYFQLLPKSSSFLIIFITKMIRKLLTKVVFNFKTMTPEDYLFNQRDSMLARKPHLVQLKPLDNANQGQSFISDEIQLVGVPKGQTKNRFEDFKMDIFQQLLIEWERDLIFLNIDPSSYIARERFMSHRCAMGEVEDYRLDGVHLIDPHKPLTWEETCVNLLSMDMLRDNKLPKDIKYKEGLYAFSYPYLQEPEQSKAITQTFISEISSQILDGKRTGYDLIDKVLYTSLMGRHKVMLGGMPETQYRMILGKGISIGEMRDIFRLVNNKNRELTIPMNIKDATQSFLPHIFLLPKDLYLSAMLKQAFQAAMQMVSIVPIEHWRPIQQYWVGPPHGINVSEATRIPDGFPGQTVEDLIEKQAMMDVMLETRVWSRNYLSNPFPYIFEDITKVDPKELEHYKKLFAKHYKKYSEFKNRQVKLLEESLLKLSLQDKSKLRDEEMAKMNTNLGEAPTLSHLKQKMTLKREKKIKISSK